MEWVVRFHPAFDEEFGRLSEEVQDALLKRAGLLRHFGPTLGRPTVDTLKGSKHANMKELRFDADNGVWRAAFAFDPGAPRDPARRGGQGGHKRDPNSIAS